MSAGVVFALLHREGRVQAVVQERPRAILTGRLLEGRTVDEALRLAGTVFALCPMAQTTALARAIAAAGGPEGAQDAGALVAERVEALVRHVSLAVAPAALRTTEAGIARAGRLAALSQDWAGLASAARAAAAVAAAAASRWLTLERGEPDRPLPLVHGDWARDTGFETALRHGVPAAASVVATVTGAAASPAAATRRLAFLGACQVLEPLLADPGFQQRPTLDGAPRQTGPIATYAPGAQPSPGTRSLAMAHALTDWAGRLEDPTRRAALAGRDCSVQSRGRAGCAVVPTSRGPFAIAVELAPDGRIQRARSAAPTEWNLHPQGALADALVGLPAGQQALAEARRVIVSLDPCVEVDVSLRACRDAGEGDAG
jgi:uptake hydrogenase large subunit